MELYHTLVIDPEDPAHPAAFRSLIFDNTYVVFVVIGTSNACKTVVEKADYYADDAARRVLRKVAWVPNHELLNTDCLDLLASFSGFLPADYSKVMAFTLSPRWHETKFIIWKDDTVDDFLISQAYWKASLRERAAV